MKVTVATYRLFLLVTLSQVVAWGVVLVQLLFNAEHLLHLFQGGVVSVFF